MREKVLEIRNLSISFTTSQGKVNAIRGVELDLYRGETLAIVGESGSGKSVTMKSVPPLNGALYFFTISGSDELSRFALHISIPESLYRR